jgi:magnesium-transporting ATPase (P-type)
MWHAMSREEVENKLRVDPSLGLDAAEAAERLKTYGPNRLPQGKKKGPLIRFLAQFNNILVYVLLIAGFIKLMLSLWLDASIIFAVVILNSLLGFLQEGRAEKALDSIRNMLSAEARAVRGGETRLIAAEDLAPGDIVLLESGDQGDCRRSREHGFLRHDGRVGTRDRRRRRDRKPDGAWPNQPDAC